MSMTTDKLLQHGGCLIIDILYDGRNQKTYQGVEVRQRFAGTTVFKKQFNSGDPVKDWKKAAMLAHEYHCPFMRSSSCDHFTMDGSAFEWGQNRNGWMVLKKAKAKKKARK